MLEQSDDISIREQHTAMAVRLPEFIGLVCAVDIDETPPCIDDLTISPDPLVTTGFQAI